ncbi:hypothetical protein [Brytella acorum]|uniref:Uncharacterized protein n=1 Tax=Brytella acorum TaxID=2959299 RepID=A0AA35Y1B2_9PROT|nr:hypothetical protein [Brytella acorum]CAI9120451.1 hypothetical protein LMG32879_001284 [Brytella acorum]
MSQLLLKQGVSFQISCVFRDARGVPVSLTGCAIEAQIRDSQANLLATLNCVQPVGVPGCVNVFFNGSTQGWEPGRYFCDVVIVRADGVIQASDTFGVIVCPSITRLGSTS